MVTGLIIAVSETITFAISSATGSVFRCSNGRLETSPANWLAPCNTCPLITIPHPRQGTSGLNT
ncbi:hypothetical protein SRABI106_03697 [Rahnella aquatilis]|nr:hypothetical protein SRABI106_03697 [Rahnella aquatilis]